MAKTVRWETIQGGDTLRTPGLQFPNGYHIRLSEKDEKIQQSTTKNEEISRSVQEYKLTRIFSKQQKITLTDRVLGQRKKERKNSANHQSGEILLKFTDINVYTYIFFYFFFIFMISTQSVVVIEEEKNKSVYKFNTWYSFELRTTNQCLQFCKVHYFLLPHISKPCSSPQNISRVFSLNQRYSKRGQKNVIKKKKPNLTSSLHDIAARL